MTLLLVMLHTGTMFAVMLLLEALEGDLLLECDAFKRFAIRIIWATAITGAIGLALQKIIEKTMFKGTEKAEIELLFSRLDLIAPALAAAGC